MYTCCIEWLHDSAHSCVPAHGHRVGFQGAFPIMSVAALKVNEHTPACTVPEDKYQDGIARGWGVHLAILTSHHFANSYCYHLKTWALFWVRSSQVLKTLCISPVLSESEHILLLISQSCADLPIMPFFP